MEKIIQSWLLALLFIGFLAILERLAFQVTGNELSRLNRSIDLTLLVSCLLVSLLLSPYQGVCNRNRLTSNLVGGVLLGSLIGPLLVVSLVTIIVNDLDGGLILFYPVLLTPISTVLTLTVLDWHHEPSSD